MRALPIVGATLAVAIGTSWLVFAARHPRAPSAAPAPALAASAPAQAKTIALGALTSGTQPRPAAPPTPSAAAPRVDTAGGDAMERERALRAAARTASHETIAWLAQVAGGNDPAATRAAAALGSVTSHDAAAELEQLGGSNASTLVRANAIHALSRAGGPRNVDFLCQTVADASQALRLRQEAALALGAIHDPSAAPCLIGALNAAPGGPADDDEQLRISLVQALGAIGSPAALAFLKTYAARDLSRDERAFVAKYVATN